MEKNSLKGIGLQFFAESAQDGTGQQQPPAEPPAPDGVEQPQGAQTPPPDPKPEKTFTRDEVNRMIAAERKKAAEEEKAKATEAEKLSKMKAEDRLQYEKEQAEKAAAEAIAELNAYKLKAEAERIARETGLPDAFLGLIDFHTVSAEQVSESIKAMYGAFQAEVESAVNEKLGQKPPSGGGAAGYGVGRAAAYAQEMSKRMQGVI